MRAGARKKIEILKDKAQHAIADFGQGVAVEIRDRVPAQQIAP